MPHLVKLAGKSIILFALLAGNLAAPCTSKQHTSLTNAHRAASVAAKRLYDDSDHVQVIEKPEALRQAKHLGLVLQQVHDAEKACSQAGMPRNRLALWHYRQMLDQHQRAFDDYQQLQDELTKPAPVPNHVAGLAADIERAMEYAEESHRDSMRQ